MLNREQLAWSAGFIDGEGHIRLTKTHTRPFSTRHYSTLALNISQCDRRVLDNLKEALGMGSVTGPYKQSKAQWSDVYVCRLSGFEKVQAAIACIWPWLGDVKKKQAKEAIMAFHQFNDRPRLSMGPKPRTSVCHPNLKHGAFGLCESCYAKMWIKRKNEAKS